MSFELPVAFEGRSPLLVLCPTDRTDRHENVTINTDQNHAKTIAWQSLSRVAKYLAFVLALKSRNKKFRSFLNAKN